MPHSLPHAISHLQVIDLATLTQGMSHQYCVYATGGPLRITLAWFDYPADTNAASVLVNNLDLQVRRRDKCAGIADTGVWVWVILCCTAGVRPPRTTSSTQEDCSFILSAMDGSVLPAWIWPLCLTLPPQVRAAGMGGLLLQGNGFLDTINTVETVSMGIMPAGSVAITVAATAIFVQASPQPYALVVLGAFTGVLASAANPVGSQSVGGYVVVVGSEGSRPASCPGSTSTRRWYNMFRSSWLSPVDMCWWLPGDSADQGLSCLCVQMTGAATAKGTGGSDGTSCTATLALISDALSTPSVTASQQVRLLPSSVGVVL